MSESIDLGTASGTIEIEDQGSSNIELLEHKLEQLDEKAGGLGHHFAEAAVGFFTAEAAMEAVKEAAHLAAEALAEITVEGAAIADLEKNFEHLAEAAHQSSDVLLGSLRDGVHGTITDFELMKVANNNLLAGIKLTTDQYKELGESAFALAQAKAIDVSSALGILDNAVLRGNDRMLKRIGIHADMQKAEEEFAAKLGVTSDKLSQEGQLEARRIAVLEAVGKVTERLGEQTDGLDEKVEQASVRYKNFVEDLGKTIASSPVVVKAFDDISAAIFGAFGDNKEAAIESITHTVEGVAEALVEVVKVGVDVVSFMVEWRAVLEPIAVGLGALAVGAAAIGAANVGVALTAKAIAGIGAASSTLSGVAIAAGAIYAAFELGKWQPVSDFFERWSLKVFYGMSDAEAKAAMEATHLAEEQKKAAEALRFHSKAVDEHKTAQAEVNTELDKQRLTVQLTKEELKKYMEAWKDLNSTGATYKETIASIPDELKEQVLYYAELGTKVETLVSAFPGLTKAQAEAAVAGVKAAQDIQKVWNDVAALQAKTHGNMTSDWLRLETDRYMQHIEILQREGKATDEALDAEAAKYEATIEAEMQSRASSIEGSRAYYQKIRDEAAAKLDLMETDYSDFTDAMRRVAREELTEKDRDLAHWVSKSQDALDKVSDKTREAAEQVKILDSAWVTDADIAEATLNRTTIMVKTLNGELISLAEAQARQRSGGSQTYDLSSQQGVDFYKKMNTAATTTVSDDELIKLVKAGATLQQLIQAGYINPYGRFAGSQGNMPSFARGGSGDFGSGTPAMLHGREIITPTPEMQAMFDALNERQAEMWRATGGVVDDAQKRIIMEMDRMKMPGYGSVPPAANVVINITAHDAAHTARVVEEQIMKVATMRRKFGL